MFKNPFSFSGRIRRTEYALSYIIYIAVALTTSYFINLLSDMTILLVPVYGMLYWFILAQGAKRCHDVGESGFYQLIPFYVFWMLFAESNASTNKYGPNPTEKSLTDTRFNASEISEENQKPLPIVPQEFIKIDGIKLWSRLWFGVTACLLLLVLALRTFENSTTILYFCSMLFVMVGYFALLLSLHEAKTIQTRPAASWQHRLLFSGLLLTSIGAYVLIFGYSNFNGMFLFLGIIYFFILIGLTYIPYKLYELFYPKVQVYA